MRESQDEFRQKLFDSEYLSPALRASYQDELDRMQNPKLVARDAWVGIALVAMLLLCTIGIVRNMVFFEAGPLMLVSWGVLGVAFAYASYRIIQNLLRRKWPQKSVRSVAHTLMIAAATVTVAALVNGLRQPSDPASTFNAFYVFVVYVACIAWSIENRISAAELAAREQSLRVECRLVDILERLAK